MSTPKRLTPAQVIRDAAGQLRRHGDDAMAGVLESAGSALEPLDRTAAVEAAARSLFDRNQAGRKDGGRFDDDGTPWTFEHLTPIDQHAYREFVTPLVDAALAAARGVS